MRNTTESVVEETLPDDEIESILGELEVPSDMHFNNEIPDYQGIRDMADDLLESRG
jgi:hypothetical protein